MNRRHLLSALAGTTLATYLSACASTGTTAPRLAPERSLTIGATSKKVKELVALAFVEKGYMLKKDSDLQLVLERRTDNFMAAVLFSSQYDSTVMTRVMVTMIGDNPTNLSWRGYLVTNPGSAFERLTEITNNPDGDNVQLVLRDIKARAEA